VKETQFHDVRTCPYVLPILVTNGSLKLMAHIRWWNFHCNTFSGFYFTKPHLCGFIINCSDCSTCSFS